jgi:integrase
MVMASAMILGIIDPPYHRTNPIRAISLDSIGHLVVVEDVHPNRSRHNFADKFLRNGGDPWSLQMMLGHSTMEMVKTYLCRPCEMA